MKYLLLALYVLSYSSGFANSTLTYVAYKRTGRRALLHFFLLLVAFFLFLLLANIGFLLNAFLGVADFQRRLGFLAAACLVYSAFNLAGSHFIHSVPGLSFEGIRRRVFLGLSVLPLGLLAFELLRTRLTGAHPQSYKVELQAVAVLTALLVVYATYLLARHRKRAVDPFFRRLIRLIIGLNVVFVPLTFLEIAFNFDPAVVLKPFSTENLYYFLGNILCAWLVGSAYFPALSSGEKTHAAAPRSSAGLGISEREWEIINLVATGLSNKEISARLGIEASTVKNHLYRIYKKTGVASRVGLLRFLQLSSAGQSDPPSGAD